MRAAARRVVVVGGGVFGATAALELRTRGWEVVLLDPFGFAHDAAASTDVSKMVRMDYGSDVFYHELADLALEGWDRWNRDWPTPLYHEDGFLVLSRAPMAPGGFEHESWQLLRRRGHEPARVGPTQVAERFPAWRTAAYADGYFNPRAGWAESGAVMTRLLELATASGVRYRAGRATALLELGSRVGGVRTEAGEEIPAERVVACAGAWMPTLLPWLSDRLHAVAQPVVYLGVREPTAFTPPHFPPWAADIAGHGWYGFPALADGRLKIGHHGAGRMAHPDARGEVGTEHLTRLRVFLSDSLPELAEAPVVGSRVCMYCDTEDGDFLVGADPTREGLVVAGGGSGHAFKFAPVLGTLVADAVEGRASRWLERLGWRDPSAARKEEARARDA